jgi:hypothetical protein
MSAHLRRKENKGRHGCHRSVPAGLVVRAALGSQGV